MLPGSGRLFEANHWIWDCEQWNQMGFSDCEGQNWEYEQRKICPYCYFHLTSLNTQWGSQGASGLVVGLRHPYRAWKHFEGDFSYTDTPGWLWWFRMFYRIKLSQNLNLKHPRKSNICENWCLSTPFHFWQDPVHVQNEGRRMTSLIIIYSGNKAHTCKTQTLWIIGALLKFSYHSSMANVVYDTVPGWV